ncbi:MAG: hypothetical protein AAFR87_09870 [Bacteroidota bacterium]
MTNLLQKTYLLILIAAMGLFVACEEDVVLNESVVENYVTDGVTALHDSSACGRFGCFEFVFPIDITLGGNTISVNDYDELRTELRNYIQNNPADSLERPSLNFPFDVITDDGSMITITERSELRRLILSCVRDFIGRRHRRNHRADRCFSLTFPLSIEFPDSTVVSVADRQELKQELRQWKADNPTSTDRPSLVFPITVELEDGTTQTVNDRTELQALKDSCSQD